MSTAKAKTMEGFQPLEKSRAEWKKLLPAERYAILFEASTERSFSSPLDGEKRAGTSHLRGLLPASFSSEADSSGTGWPSFFQALPGGVATKRDFKPLPRTEYPARRCGGHQVTSSMTGRHPPDSATATTGSRWSSSPTGRSCLR
jgi:peptide-methionine (R)-S-oxide reductase